MANRRLPDHVHELRGTTRKDRHGDPKKKPAQTALSARSPAWLSTEAKKIYNRTVKNLGGYVAESDKDAVSVYSTLLAEYQDDSAKFTSAKLSQLRGLMNDLGMTPGSRDKAAALKEPPKRNKYADFM